MRMIEHGYYSLSFSIMAFWSVNESFACLPHPASQLINSRALAKAIHSSWHCSYGAVASGPTSPRSRCDI